MAFKGAKEHYIAEHEKYYAWPAILLVFSKMKELPETIDVQALRRDVASAIGFPFSELAVRLALVEDTFELADPVSEHPTEKYFRLRKSAIENFLRVHSSRSENRLTRLQELPHDTFRSEVNKARKEAANEFDRAQSGGILFKPHNRFTDYTFEYLKSELSNPPALLRVPPRKSGSTDWTKWGTILTGLSIVVAVLLWKFS